LSTDLVRVAREGAVATVTLSHPPVNAISQDVLAALRETFAALREDPEVRVAVLTGEGAIFSAGADLASAAQSGPLELMRQGRATYQELARFPKPLIAAVNGLCVGGGLELALLADLRLCAREARFGQPEINLGIIPGWGGTQRLPQAIGLQRATELILSGRLMRAEEAEAAGLVLRSYPDDELRDKARNLARRLADKPPLALAAAKAAVHAWADAGATEGHRQEGEAMERLTQTQDAAEGVMAFLQKRRPQFTGR
jgi:enoyl-CoA hydratase/carnithine racemase